MEENADVKAITDEYFGQIHMHLITNKSSNGEYPQSNMKFELDPIPWAIGNCNAQEEMLFIRNVTNCCFLLCFQKV